MTNTCTACNQLARLSPMLKCNKHRTESMSTTLINKARAVGHDVDNFRDAEIALDARPVVIG